jgi:small subunit ribosomal protein S20e
MSYVAKGEKDYDAAGPVPAAKLHKIRITLTSSNVKNLEKCSCFLPLVSSAVLLTFSK